MTNAIAGRSLDFGSGDYDAIERAVMETPRGRWFLAQRDQRQRMGETQRILDALKKLEGVLAAIPAHPPPADGGEAPAPALAAAATAAQALSMKNLKYFKQDEAVFAPAAPAAPKLAAVETAKPAEPEIPLAPMPATPESGDKRRIVIIRRAATEPMDVPPQAELAASPPS
ncbi:MAG: hypothetical protein ACT4SY_12880 [Hyphomicrobiales bacterium]